MRLRNVSGYPLQIPALGRDVAPGEVIDTGDLGGYDPDRDGPITGMAPIEEAEEMPAGKTTKSSKAGDKAGDDGKETSK